MKPPISLSLLVVLLGSTLAAAQPSVTVSPEPLVGSSIVYLPMAPSSAGGSGNGQLSLRLDVMNKENKTIHLSVVAVAFPGTSVAPKMISSSLDIKKGETQPWNFKPEDNILLPSPAPSSLRLTLYFDTYSPLEMTYPLAAYRASTPTGGNAFWAKVGDLRPGEYWVGHGAVHDSSAAGSQLFAYDVGVEAWDNTAGQWSLRLPNTNGTHNSDYRIWGKPLYAVASGTVKALRNDFPTNDTPGSIDPEIAKFWAGGTADGNGNFFSIGNGSEVILYAHMQPGSLNPRLTVGSVVHEGDFLGLAGNSGSSSEPHLHIHAVKSNEGPRYWQDGPLRPLPLQGAFAIDTTLLPYFLGNAGNAPWAALSNRGIPSVRSMIWPSSQAPVELTSVTVKSLAIASTGQPWVVESDGRFRTSNDRLDNEQGGTQGVFLDVNPSGSGKAVVLSGGVPYVIGNDDRVWKGTPSGWVPVQTSGGARRLTVDESTGKVWIIALDNTIASFDPATQTWSAVPGAGLGKDICVTKGTVYLVGMDDRIWKSTGGGSSPLAGTFMAHRVVVDGSTGNLWALGMNDSIWYLKSDGTWSEYPGGGRAKELVLFKSVPYIVAMNGVVWRGTLLSGWQYVNTVQPL